MPSAPHCNWSEEAPQRPLADGKNNARFRDAAQAQLGIRLPIQLNKTEKTGSAATLQRDRTISRVKGREIMSLNAVSGLTPLFTTPSIPIPPPVSQARTSPAFALYPATTSSGTSGGGQIADTKTPSPKARTFMIFKMSDVIITRVSS
jgi:hypothetical protein